MKGSVAVTGANGFVGNKLCLELIERGWNVRGLVRTAYAANSLPKSVKPYILPSMDSIEACTEIFRGCTAIVHLAAKVHDMSFGNLEEYMHVNTECTKNLAKASIDAGVQKFIYISTIKVNGEYTKDRPFTYNDAASPQDPYSISKYEAECVLRDIEKNSNLEVTIIRPPLVYGPRVKGNLAVLMKWLDKGAWLPLANIHNSRSLLNINNLIDFILCCLTNHKAAGETFLLSDDHNISTSELVSDIAQSMGKKARLFWLPKSIIYFLFIIMRKRSTYGRLFNSLSVDISHTKIIMEWKPKYDYRNAISSMVECYLKNHKDHNN